MSILRDYCLIACCLFTLNSFAADILLMERNPSAGPLKYPGKNNFRSDRGTVELQLKLGDNFGARKQNEHLASLILDENHAIGLYYNYMESGLVFFIRNVDAPGANRHSKDYSAFLVAPKLNWKPGERHHVALSYEPERQFLFIDGKAVRWQEYLGSLAGKWNDRSRIEINRDSAFIIEAFRIWDDAFAPRNLKSGISSVLPVFQEKVFPPSKPHSGLVLKSGDSLFRWSPGNPLPDSIVSGSKELLPGGSRLLFGDNPVNFPGKAEAVDGQISGRFVLNGETSLELRTTAIPSGDNTIKLNITLTNCGSQVWCNSVTLDLGAMIAEGTAFTTANGAPFALKNGNPEYAHGLSFFSSRKPNFALPVAAIYHTGQDIGLTLAQPMSVKDSISIDFGGENARRYLSMTNADVTIRPGESRTLEYYLKVHPADFRPALQLMMEISPEAFLTKSIQPAKQKTIDAGMMIGGPSDPAFLRQMASLMVGYREITIGNGKQIVFGEYVPDSPDAVSMAFYNGINRQIKALHQAGILGMIYLQARECKRIDYARKNFPESLQYDPQGKVLESYSFGAKMLCRKGSAWYGHLLAQLQKSLEMMPEADGVFFDNCWDMEYADIINAYGDYLHSRGLLLATNGISHPCARSSDNVMAEGTRVELQWIGFFGLAKPVSYIPIYHYYGFGISKEREMAAPALPVNLARDLKSCLLNGGFYSFNYRGARYFGEESMRMLSHYLPLQQELKGKRWYLVPHALTLPEGIQGNVFERREGGLTVFIVSRGMPFTGEISSDFTIRIRTGKHQPSGVLMRHLEDIREKPVEFSNPGNGFIEIRVKNHISITMIKVESL